MSSEPPLTRITPGLVFRWAIAASLGVLLVYGAVLAVFNIRHVLVQVFVALFIAVSLDPAVRWLNYHGVRRSIAVAAIFVLALLVLVAFFWSVGPPLLEQATNLAKQIPGYVGDLPKHSKAYREFADRYGLTTKITAYLATLPASIGTDAVGYVSGFLSALFNILLVVVLTIYFMADLPRLRHGLVRLAPRERRPRVASVVNIVLDKVGDYMIGNLIISAFAGLTSFLCLWFAGVPYALPLAFFVAIADLIPLFGATIGASGCLIVALLTVNIWPNTVAVALFFLVYQQIENYLIVPRVLRGTVDLSSVAVLVAALCGARVLGVVGALMAIPIVAAAKVIMTPMVETLDKLPHEREGLSEPESPPPGPLGAEQTPEQTAQSTPEQTSEQIAEQTPSQPSEQPPAQAPETGS